MVSRHQQATAGMAKSCKGQAMPDHPGSQTASSLTTRISSNPGDPIVGAKHCALPDKLEQRGRKPWRWEVGGAHSSDERG